MGKRYQELTLEERERIAVLKGFGKSIREIAQDLGRNHSTVSREIRRNSCVVAKRRCYLVHRAEMRTRRRKMLRGKRERLKDPRIRDYVREKLQLHWSPEQIAGRIRLDHLGLTISHEAIYQYVYEEAWELFHYLPRKHKRRRLRFNYRKPRGLVIPSRVFIGERPERINQRLVLGHWEADSAVSRTSSVALHVLLERKSRLVKITKILRNTSDCIRDTITRKLFPLSPSSRLSITYDNGVENGKHLEVNRELKTQSFFCNPYHSWEKGSVENAIGLVRRFLPKKTDFERIPSLEISQIENLINNRPRKCLNYKTPKEVFKSLAGALTD